VDGERHDGSRAHDRGMSKQILVVGCGAIGGLFAAMLSSVAEVTAFDTNAEHVDAINARGIRIIGNNARTAKIRATADPSSLKGGAFDAIMFLIKSKMTADALARLRPMLAGNPTLVTLQNGMGNAEILLADAPARVIRGVTMNAGRYIEPGCIEFLIEGKSWLGPVRGDIEDVRALADLLNKAGMETEVVADPMGAVWAKFVFNCVMNPLGALMMGDNAARYDSSEMRALIDEMAAECTAVVRALGGSFAFPPMDFVDKVRSGQVRMSTHAGSMALDIARGAPTEIDELTGFIVREGRRLNVPVPNCTAVYRLVKGLELAAQRRVTNPR
jgi:2-dehydropantoate 2-reductase